jgi:GT2 family glycosyltransferase
MSIPVLIIPVLNRFDLLEKSLESIDHPIDNILIINNAKEEYTPSRKDLNIHILHMPSNQGISGSWNLGIKSFPHSSWWLISSADTSFKPGSLNRFEELSGPSKFVKSIASYSCFSLGEEIVKNVGLFDEYIYPAYYEDNDYDDRVHLAGLSNMFETEGIDVDDSGGSQTIKSDPSLSSMNSQTFVKNREYYNNKKTSGDYTVRGWDLTRRRENEWLK